ncbi:TetR/AcrR family transcriptional regulator [Streptomyces sp. NPDC046805]|uniref:TetR/AcrR family transcriptional regulator n=1 Tax=Streptomyces sp. NPDC046805 TaxID=3155134 RepID=UPI0033ED4429
MTSHPAPRAPRAPSKRELILAAATHAFATQPYDEVNVNEIARSADVAHGLVFYYFGDKRGLYIEVISNLLVELDRFVAAQPHERSGEQIIRGALARYLEFIAKYPVTMLALLRTGLHEPDLRAVYSDAREVGLALILSGLNLDCDTAAPRLRMALRGWMGYTDAMAADWLANDQDLPIDECVDLSFDALVSALHSAEGHSPEPRGTALHFAAAP